MVANITNQGTKRVKKLTGVFSSSTAPTMPPTTLKPNSAHKLSRPTPPANLRPASDEVIWLGNSAMVDVMLADSGFNPANSSAGNVMNEPPPASTFWVPAHKPASATNSNAEKSGDEVMKVN